MKGILGFKTCLVSRLSFSGYFNRGEATLGSAPKYASPKPWNPIMSPDLLKTREVLNWIERVNKR